MKHLKLVGILILGATLACSGGNETGGSGGSGSGGGSGGNNGGNISLEGRWFVQMTSNNGNRTPYVADIDQDNTSFTGVIKFGPTFSKNFSGTISSGSLSFASSDDTLHFSGHVVTSDSIEGNWYNKFTQDSGTWYAIRPSSHYSWYGEFTGELYNGQYPNIDTTIVDSGKWMAKVLKGQHHDTVLVAGEILIYYGADTFSLSNPVGGIIYNDSLNLSVKCTVSGSNGQFMFYGNVRGDSVSGQWGVIPLSGMTPGGTGTFAGYIGN